MSDAQTLKAYAEAAARYAAGFARTKNTDQEADYAAFIALLPPNARVLDLGCGPGHWTARMRGDGYRAEGMDASPEMASQAAASYGLEVKVQDFAALNATAAFDGIWANFSLLHAPKREFPAHLQRIHRALRPKGALSLGMKLGDGEARDSLGRFYAYYSEDALLALLQAAGFSVVKTRCGNGKGLAGQDETFVVVTAHA